MWQHKRHLGTYKMFGDNYDYEVELCLLCRINDNVVRKSEDYYRFSWTLVERTVLALDIRQQQKNFFLKIFSKLKIGLNRLEIYISIKSAFHVWFVTLCLL